MTPNPQNQRERPDRPEPETANADSSEHLPELDDQVLQERYRKAFIEQIKRRQCPGCGDDGALF